MKYGEWKYSSTILDLTLEGCEWVVSRPGRFYSEEGAPGTRWIGDWVRLGAGLDAVEKSRLPLPGN
jgi:hypothetical protein